METSWQVAGVLSVALIVAKVANAAEVSVLKLGEPERFDFDIPSLPLQRAKEAFTERTGRDTYVGPDAFEACRNFVLAPLVGRFTAAEAWRKLTSAICAPSGVVIERPGEAPVYMVDHPWVAQREIRIPRARLIDVLGALRDEFAGLYLEYRARDSEEAQRLIGPIEGTLTAEEALKRIEAQLDTGLHHVPFGPYAFLLDSEPFQSAGGYQRYRYVRECSCPVTIDAVTGEEVTVIKPAIGERVSTGIKTFTRQQIESTGASTLPQFFRYLAQNAYTRPEGYIASGAQYADFRGLGRDTHLVTINGRRTLPSANNITSSAFDLNTIPLPAVDHVNIRVDSGAMRSGSDAIAGTIDIVTRRDLEAAMEVRYGFAEGGAQEQRATVSAGEQGGRGGGAILFDYYETGDLLGAARAMSRDQDYFTRYGGTDYRASFGISSMDGTNLPGLRSPLAGIPLVRESDALSVADLMPGTLERVSLSRYQSIVPATRRTSAVGSADYTWRGIDVAADLLWVKRDAAFHYYPAIAAGEVGADHPGNPFDESVWVDVLLTGARSRQQHVESELRRGVLSASGRLHDVRWDAAVIRSEERAQAWLDHGLDARLTAQALLPTPGHEALDVFAMQPGGADAPQEIWAEAPRQPFSSSGTHLAVGIDAPLPGGRLQLGLERRSEQMQFNAAVGEVERTVRGKFARLTIPLIEPERAVAGMKRLTAFAGVRRDAFSDAQDITRTHFELEWKMTDWFGVNANLATQYRPPSLFELKLPAVSVPVQIYDPVRAEAVATQLIAGGNPDLKPTTGKSTHIRATYGSPEGASDGFTASLNYFSIRVWDRIAALPIPMLLASAEQLPDRVLRDSTGRLLSVNTTRDNVGRLYTRGLDLSIHDRITRGGGSWTPRLDLTWIDTFKYSDLPIATAHMSERVGIASEQGTLTDWRAVLSLGWKGEMWGATTYLRLIPAYHDVDGERIDEQALVDFNVSYAPNPHMMLTLGAMDLANTSPHFARVGAATGYDSSQWDPVGRRVMLTAKVSL